MIELFELVSVEEKTVVWSEFGEHHYSPESFNMAARTFLAYRGDTVVGMTAVIEPSLDMNIEESSAIIGASVARNSEELNSNARGRFLGSALKNL